MFGNINLVSRILGLLMIVLVLALAPSIVTANALIQQTATSQSESDVSTAGGLITANITLDSRLYSNSVSNVYSVSSNATESPTAVSYTAPTRVLLVGTLSANITRTLTLGYYTGADATNLLGMSVVDDFGAMLIILGILTVGGVFTIGGQMAGGVKDLLWTVGITIVAVVALTFMESIVDYNNAIYNAASGVEQTLYSIISLLIYVGIIGSVAYRGYKAGRAYYKSRRGGATSGTNF